VDDLVVGGRVDGHRLLRQAKEEFAATPGSSAIESEGELIQIVVQVFLSDGPLMGSEQPPLQQGDDLVNAGQQLRGSLLFARDDRDLVLVAYPFQGHVSLPAVGVDDAPTLH